jgi:hypothetical protein
MTHRQKLVALRGKLHAKAFHPYEEKSEFRSGQQMAYISARDYIDAILAEWGEEEYIAEAATTHSLERTSPKGGPFIGRCVLCGKPGLKSSDALKPCPNPRGVTSNESVINAIEGNEKCTTST